MSSVESAVLGAVVGNLVVLIWASWPVIVHFYRHGFDNHDCQRGCCR